jgi:hypothetical protein
VVGAFVFLTNYLSTDISRCPDDPEKTQIVLLAHANPGGNVPQWAVKTAVNALVPIEPFKLFHKINENVKRNQPQLRERLAHAEMVSTVPPGRSPRPAGIAQMGFACFWPQGGGATEGHGHKPQPTQQSEDGSEQESEQGSENAMVDVEAVSESAGD